MEEKDQKQMSLKQRIQQIKIINEPYTRWKWRERRVSFGKAYPDKTFFVIRRAECKVGLFSHVMTNMGMVDYALKKGYIPVIDMQNSMNNYLEEEKRGKENAWEYYFKQPCGYSLTDINEAQNVILSDGLITKAVSYPDFGIATDEEQFHYWHDFFRRYLKVTDDIARKYETARESLLGNEKVLGVLARGTDYVASRPKGHPIQPTAEQIIVKSREVMERHSCQRIYLATEDASIYEKLKAAFGEKLIAPNTKRYVTVGGQNINDLMGEGGNQKAANGREYLLSIMLLAGCDCLVAGNAGGTHGALLMNTEYEYKYIFQLGTY